MREKILKLVNEYFDEIEHGGHDMPKTMGGVLRDMMSYNKYTPQEVEDDPKLGPAMGNPSDHGG